MIEKLLRDAVIITVGKQAENIVPLINSKKHVNEFLIAKKLDITINQTRNILYKLSDHGLVSSIRKKDKKKGWYTYFWKIEKLKVLIFLKSILEKKRIQMENQIKNRETKQFYICKTCRIEFNEENALLYDFTCNECGNTFELNDNTKLIKELKRNQLKFEKELELIDTEIESEKAQIEKERQKEIKKEEKEKAVKKAEKKAERKAAKEKESIKTGKKEKVIKKATKKKTSKKKVVKKKTTKKKTIKKKK